MLDSFYFVNYAFTLMGINILQILPSTTFVTKPFSLILACICLETNVSFRSWTILIFVLLYIILYNFIRVRVVSNFIIFWLFRDKRTYSTCISSILSYSHRTYEISVNLHPFWVGWGGEILNMFFAADTRRLSHFVKGRTKNRYKRAGQTTARYTKLDCC